MSRALGAYELREELGRGGCGVVYRAFDPRLGRDVALKVLFAGELEPIERLRLTEEARAMARVRDPGLAVVHAVELEGPRPHLVMELIEGEPLERRLERLGALSPQEAAEVCLSLARTLERLHAQGIVHRDLKPSNVLLRPDGQPVLLDLGLALLLDRAARLTRSGDLVGTPAFMAPEQARGEREAVGPATDVWGLGALLSTLVRGAPPFPGPGAIAMLTRIIEEAPALPESAGPRELCARCLEKDPRARPALGEVIAALERLARGEPGPPRSRRGLLVGGGAATVLAVALPWLARRADPRVGAPAAAPLAGAPLAGAPSAGAPSAEAPGEPARPASAAQAAAAAELTARARHLARQAEHERAFELVQRALDEDPAHGPALVVRAKLRQVQGRTDEALSDLRRAVELDPRDPAALALLGALEAALRRDPSVPPEVERALELDPDCPEALYVRGWVRLQQGRPGAEEDLRRATRANALGVVEPASLALALLLRGERAGAAEALEVALENGPHAPEPLAVSTLLREAEGESVAARRALDEALTISHARAYGYLSIGLRLPELAPLVRVFLAEALLREERVDQAEQLLLDAERELRSGASSPPRQASLLRARARVHLAQGRHAEAEDLLRAAIQDAPAPDLFLDRARALVGRRRYGEALNDLVALEAYFPSPAEEVAARCLRVDVCLRTGQLDQARATLEELERRVPDHPQLPALRARLERSR